MRLDQFSSLYGKKDSLILCDFRTVEVLKTVSMPAGWSMVVANTMVKHNLVESDYNLRRQSCENALAAIQKKYPAVKALRDVDSAMLDSCKNDMDTRPSSGLLQGVVGSHHIGTTTQQLRRHTNREVVGLLIRQKRLTRTIDGRLRGLTQQKIQRQTALFDGRAVARNVGLGRVELAVRLLAVDAARHAVGVERVDQCCRGASQRVGMGGWQPAGRVRTARA